MKVLLSCDSLRPPLTGIGNYTHELLLQLMNDATVESVVCVSAGALHEPAALLRTLNEPEGAVKPQAQDGGFGFRARAVLRQIPFTYSAQTWLVSRRFAKKVNALKGFVYHEPNYILKPFSGPCVATVHDLSTVLHPEFHPAERVKYFERSFAKTIRHGCPIITDSELVRRQLLEFYSIDPGRVHTIHLAAGQQFAPRDQEGCRQVLDALGLQYRQFLLFVGTIEPRKNVDVLLDAYLQLPTTMRSRIPLVVAGSSGWLNGKLMDRMKGSTKDGVRYLRFVAAEDLPILYAAATAFVYPSRYEGFGLPVLEAMASQTPVICTADSSMAEFAGEAALTCDVDDVDALVALMRELIEDDGHRERRAAMALMRAGDFSWRRVARETLAVYGFAAGI